MQVIFLTACAGFPYSYFSHIVVHKQKGKGVTSFICVRSKMNDKRLSSKFRELFWGNWKNLSRVKNVVIFY
jgi:hypothetical protein